MRDFRDAKTMAQTLRESLTAKSVTISHSESLELVSRMFGLADWNTLSAMLQSARRDTTTPVGKRPGEATSYPAIPLRDFVPFPSVNFAIYVGRDGCKGSYRSVFPPADFPMFAWREKTLRALNHAFERHREVVLAVQRQAAVDEPGLEDIHEIGVLARVIQSDRQDDGTMRVFVEAHRRVVICRFLGAMDAFEAEISDLSEGPVPYAPDLILRAIALFERYAAARQIQMRQTWPTLRQTRDPGRAGDMIATYMTLPISHKQSLLATLDPVARLERVNALLESNA
ncbi:MAG TPA: LON peptidase substrate-binding domain-containing protein [Bradyrhizobium sp.]|nr:LON peptidase substrate-binding domain-containing protein [Bradyrhizobium sp.]